MGNGGGNIALDEEVVGGLNGDVLRDPPVAGCEGECGGASGAIDGDLIAAGDGEGDVGGGGSAKDSAVDDGGAGIFCQACGELGLLEKEELAAEGGAGVDARQDGGGGDAGECGDGGGAIQAIEAVAVVLDEGVCPALGEFDVAVGVGKLRSTPEIASGCQAEGVECGEINDIPA